MKVRVWLTCLAMATGATACGGEDSANAGSDGETDSSADGSSGTNPTEATFGTDSNSGSDSEGSDTTDRCQNNSDCDDGDPCTANTCNESTCEYAPGPASVECRPAIDVDFPPRGGSIQAATPDEVVTVVGTAQSPQGEITSLTLNGESVEVQAGGKFSYDVAPSVGGNLLILETEDSTGQTRRRVQSFLWGTQYVKPTEPVEGMAPAGIAIYFSQEGLDDGDPSGPPYNDLASILGLAVTGLDISSFFDSTTPITSAAGYDIYLTDLRYGDSAVHLQGIDGGLALTASLLEIEGDLTFDCTQLIAGCTLAGGDGTGGLTVDELAVTADVKLSVDQESHELEVELENVQTELINVDLFSNNGWTNFLLTVIEPFILGGVISDLENELNSQLSDVLTPLLSEGLQSFNFNTSLDFPSLGNPDDPIMVDLITDFGNTDFHDGIAPPDPSPPQGGAIILRGGAFADGEPTYEGLGIPLRNGCESGAPQLSLTRDANMEIGLHDDLINEILYAAWKGGFLEFPLPPDLVGKSTLYEDLVVDVSGMLPPVATDCRNGQLLAQIGDIRIDASLVLLDDPVSFTSFTTVLVKVDITATDGEIGISLAGIEDVQTELNVNEDSAIEAETLLINVLETALIDGLIGGLGGDALGAIALPEIDLSESLGLPPGTALISIQIDDVVHQPGITVVRGSL